MVILASVTARQISSDRTVSNSMKSQGKKILVFEKDFSEGESSVSEIYSSKKVKVNFVNRQRDREPRRGSSAHKNIVLHST